MSGSPHMSDHPASGLGSDGQLERLLLAAVDQAVVATDTQGVVIYWNRAAEKLYGWAAEEALNQNIRDLTLSDATRTQGEEIMAALLAGESWEGEFRCSRRDGTSFPAHVRDNPVLDDAENLVGIIGVSHDTSEHRDLMSELKEAQRRFRALADSNTIGITITDESGVLEANDRFLDLVGYTREDLEAGRIELARFTPPEWMPVTQQAIQQVLGESAASEPFEKELVRQDGSRVPVLVAGALLDREPPRFLGVITDLSEQKRAETAAQEAHALLEAINATAPLGRAFYDTELRIVIMNEYLATLDGVAVVDCLGRKPSECLPDLGSDIEGWIGYVIETGEPLLDFEAQLRKPGGERVDTLRTYWPVKLENGRLLGVGAVIQNITERKKLELEVGRARELAEIASLAKSEFLSQMSHELRTPLNAVLGFAQLLQLKELPVEDVSEAVERIIAGGEHLLTLTNQLLEIEQIESGRLSISLEPVAVTSLVIETLELMAPLASRREIELGNGVPHDPDWHVLADRARLKQVLLNLLSNAVKYGPDRNEIRVTADLARNKVLRIGVCDAGPGIGDADRERIFKPFERLGRDIEGTGLGLALSKGLVEAMGGAIGLESTLGEGSLFWIELSLVESPLETHKGDGGEQPLDGPAATAAQTVLYVEDNLPNLKLLEAVFKRRPTTQLLSAMQGQLGLELAAEEQPDLILLDLHLPDIPGEEVLRRLQADKRTSGIPVIVISADATKQRMERLLEAGAHTYLTKPLNVKLLLQAVDELHTPDAVPLRAGPN